MRCWRRKPLLNREDIWQFRMIPKTLFDVTVGDTVFRFLGTIGTPLPLRVSAVTEERIICGDWQFDKRTGAEIDEFLGWGPALTGSYILAVPFHVESN